MYTEQFITERCYLKGVLSLDIPSYTTSVSRPLGSYRFNPRQNGDLLGCSRSEGQSKL